MRRTTIIISLLSVSVLVCLVSFHSGFGRVMIFDTQDKIADAHIEKILDVLQSRDSDALKSLFSKQALKIATDFDTNSEYLFDFFRGDVATWERNSFSSDTYNEAGKESVMLISSYTVTTDVDAYRFLVIDYTTDQFNQENVGLYALYIIKATDEATYFRTWQEMQSAGICIPSE